MTRKLVVLVAVGVVTATASTPAGARPGQAHVLIETVVGWPDISDDTPAVGLTCGLVSVTAVGIDDHTQTGVLFGGPLVATDAPVTISMRCAVHVGEGNGAHRGAAVCGATWSSMLQATVFQPIRCTYTRPFGAPVYVCTEVDVGGWVRYWDPTATGGLVGLPGVWSDSEVVPCKLVSGEADSDLVQPVLDAVDGLTRDVVDPITCPIARSLSPGLPGIFDITPDGDTILTDCPPYGT